MKAKRRHELQTNVLANWLGQQIKAIKPYASWIVGGLIAVAVVTLFISVRGTRQSTESADSWDRFEEASDEGFSSLRSSQPVELENAIKRLEKLANKHGRSPLGVQANMTLGDLCLKSGQLQMESNKASAKAEFQRAADYYAIVVSETRHALLLNRARFCLGQCYEWLNKFQKAQEYYAQVEQPYQSFAQMRWDDLDRKSTHVFYEKFAQWKPKPTAPSDRAGDRDPAGLLDLEDAESSPSGTLDDRRYLDATGSPADPSGEDPAGDESDDESDDEASSDEGTTDETAADKE